MTTFTGLAIFAAIVVTLYKLCVKPECQLDRARVWYAIAAWASSNGDASRVRAQHRQHYLREAAAKSQQLSVQL